MSRMHNVMAILTLACMMCSCRAADADIDLEDCEPNYFADGFEEHELGLLENNAPWEYGAGPMGKLDVNITNTECAEGDKCLKINMLSVSNDPLYDAYVRANTGCYKSYPPIYAQFYIKYLYMDGRVKVGFNAGPSFRIRMANVGNYGSVEVSGAPSNIVVDNGNIFPDVWYRIELMLNKPRERVMNIRVYEADVAVPVQASTYISDIAVDSIKQIRQNWVTFDYMSTYLFEHPDSDLNNFSLFIDDFVISDDPAVLQQGF